MAQTRDGAIKQAARRIGIAVDDYLAHIAAGRKWCHKCRTWRSRIDFPIDRSRGDGLAATCRACRSTTTRPGPTIPERRRKRSEGLEWCRDCGDWLPAADCRGGRCRLHINAVDRDRYARDPAYRAERRQHAHSRKRGVKPVPAIGQDSILEDFGGCCAYCGAAAESWDHIIPVSQGGETVPWNIVPACIACNSSKNARDWFEWLNDRQNINAERINLILDRMALEYEPIAI